MECAELEVLYADLNFLKFAIKSWSEKQLHVWEELKKTLEYEYNPIHNYDRTEEWNDKLNSEQHLTVKSDGSDKTYVTGFNSDTEQLRDSQIEENSSKNDNNSTVNNERKGRAFGNIGVMSTQEMIQKQRDVVQFNIYDYIIKDYILI